MTEIAHDGPPGLPGLTGLDHVGFTVPDLEAATRFLVDVLGCEYLYSLGPLADDAGDWMAEHLNVHPRAECAELRFFRCGGAPVFEVFQYTSPDQRTDVPRNSDVGGHHIAFYVEDLDAAVSYLRRCGVRVLGEPTVSRGPHLGQRWVYFLAPWGMQFELVSYPHGRAFYLAEDAVRGAGSGSGPGFDDRPASGLDDPPGSGFGDRPGSGFGDRPGSDMGSAR